MLLRHHPADPIRIAPGQSPGVGETRAFIRPLALPVALSVTIMLSACGASEDEQADDPGAEASASLHEAQPLHFRDATLLPEGSENGTYSELATVRYSEQIRDSTELDKPECVDAANHWGDLDAVRDAPASVAAYEWEEGAVSSMLVRLEEAEAAEALAIKPPETCSSYSATYEDGSESDYGVSDLDLPRVGDESRAFVIEVRSDTEENRMFSLVYRNGGLLGTTSILGSGDLEAYEDMLVEFSEAAVERQRQTLG